MERPSIDLKAISCRGVRSPIPFHKPALFATVSASADPGSRFQTPVDRNGGENPEWGHPIRLYFAPHPGPLLLLLRFDLKSKAPLLGDLLVGAASVPVADLAAQGPAGALRHASYQVLAPDGKPNGVLSFSYVLNDIDAHLPAPPRPALLPPAENQLIYPPPSPDQKIHYPTVELEPLAVYPPLTDAHPTAIYPPWDVSFLQPAPSASYYPPAPSINYYPPAPARGGCYPTLTGTPATGGRCYPAPGCGPRAWYG